MQMGIRKKLLVATAVSMVGVAGLGSTAAFAGEVTGSGKPIVINAKSDCAFSGLEDWASTTDQPLGEILVKPGVTQSWGQIPKADRDFLTTIGVSPGELCNAHKNPIK